MYVLCGKRKKSHHGYILSETSIFPIYYTSYSTKFSLAKLKCYSFKSDAY